MVERQKSIENKENFDYKNSAYVVGDSLSVGLTSGIDVKKSVKEGRKTTEMLTEVEKNISSIKDKKVLFFLGGTNDVASGISEDLTIQNIKKIAEIAEKNGLKFVPGTIPNMKKFENDKKVQEKIEKINNFIKTNFPNFIDYNELTKDFKQADGVHFDRKGYSSMRQAQEKKFLEVSGKSNEKTDDLKSEKDEYLKATIDSLKTSIISFESNIRVVFSGGKEMNAEQKQKMQEIIESKKSLILEFEKIGKELNDSKYELIFRNQQLGKTEKIPENISAEFIEVLNRASDLEKIVLELDEKQSILLKEFRISNSGRKLNDKIEKIELEKLSEITSVEFLEKPFEERLKYVTVGNIDSENIKNGNVKELEINFSFNGRFNRQLYLNTTAGMILPDEVRSVVVNGTVYNRNENALKGEFFDRDGKRLIIKDETKINILTLETKENLEKKFISKVDLTKFEKETDKEIVLEAEKRGIPSEIAIGLFSEEMSKIDDINLRKILLEELFVEIDRKKGEFVKKYNEKPVTPEGKISLEFLSFLFEVDDSAYEKTAKNYGYKEEQIKNTKPRREQRVIKYDGNLNLEKFASMNISKEEVERIRKMKRFHPNSADTVTLFRIAAKVAGISESWATNSNLHYILKRESNGVVGRVNYTLSGKGISTEELKAEALRGGTSSQISKRIGASSTATGLGQLLISNIDIFYPSGRKGIGDPIEEAVGFLKYIENRYGNPDVAKSVYGRKGIYTHAVTGKKISKNFREGY